MKGMVKGMEMRWGGLFQQGWLNWEKPHPSMDAGKQSRKAG